MQGSDLKERLRARAESYRASGPSAEHTAMILDEAASEIERLEAEVAQLKIESSRHAYEAGKAREERDSAERKSEGFWGARASAAEAQRDKLKEVAGRYFTRYCQDEADDVENCVCGQEQHEDAKALAEALASMEKPDV